MKEKVTVVAGGQRESAKAESIFHDYRAGERHSKGSWLNIGVGPDVLQALTVKSGCASCTSIRVASRVILVPLFIKGGDFLRSPAILHNKF